MREVGVGTKLDTHNTILTQLGTNQPKQIVPHSLSSPPLPVSRNRYLPVLPTNKLGATVLDFLKKFVYTELFQVVPKLCRIQFCAPPPSPRHEHPLTADILTALCSIKGRRRDLKFSAAKSITESGRGLGEGNPTNYNLSLRRTGFKEFK